MEVLPAGAMTMTVLFTDLVGSTAMRSRVGDDRADALRREHDEVIGRAVDEHGGLVVKGLGDGVMAVFTAPSMAVASAVAINQAVARRNQTATEPFVLRMGLSVGEVRVEGDDVFGTPVVEAARLCARAADDQILAAVWVKALAGSRAAVEFVPVGELLLKGLVEPLESYEVEWREAHRTMTVPFPTVPFVDCRAPFVGRQKEWRELADAWSRAQAGSGPVVVIEGESGVGASRLAVEAARRRHDDGALVLFGGSDPASGAPLRPVAEALRFQARHLEDERLRGRWGADAALLARLVPEVAQRLGTMSRTGGEPDDAGMRLPEAVAGWLSATSMEDPVVWLLDDLHRASASSLAVIGAALRSSEPSRLLVLITATSGSGADRAALDAMLTEVAAGPREVISLRLAGLDPTGTDALVGGRLGEAIDHRADPVLDRIHRATGGYPRAVGEVVDHLLRTGQVRGEGGHWVTVVDPEELDLGVPAPTESVATADLPVLAAAALAGDLILPEVVASAVGEDVAVIRTVLERAGEQGIALSDPRSGEPVSFTSRSVRDDLVHRLEPSHRAALAAAVAGAWERVVPDGPEAAAVTASLWSRAAADDPAARPTAVDAAARAGAVAGDHLAYLEAASWYETALGWQERVQDADPVRTVDLMLARGEAQRLGGDAHASATLVTAAPKAARLGRVAELARVVTAGRRWSESPRVTPDPDRLAVLGVAATVDTDDVDLRARILAALALELVVVGDPSAAALARQASEMVGGHSTEARAEVLMHRLAVVAEHEWADDPEAEFLSAMAELESLELDRIHPRWRFALAVLLTRRHLRLGDLGTAGIHLADARRQAGRLGAPEVSWALSRIEAAVALQAGELDRASAFVEAAASLSRRSVAPEGSAADLALWSAVRRWQGRSVELESELADLVDRSPSAAAFGAAAALGSLRPSWALAVYERAAAAGFPVGYGAASAASLANLAELAALARDRRGALVLSGRVGLEAGRRPMLVVPGPVVAHTRALLAATSGDHDGADRWFAEAVAVQEESGAALFAAETRVVWAQARQARGDHDQVAELAGQAALAARARGASGLESAALALLERPVARLA